MADSRRRTLWQRFKRAAMLDIAILVMALTVTEIGFRVIEPSWAIRPTSKNLTFGFPVSRNGFGFRGPEFSLAKPDDVFRVLVFGNSVTFGTGVARQDIFTTRLGAELGRRYPGMRAEIINAAPEGSSVPMFQRFMDKYGASISADLVVLAFNSAMIAQASKGDARQGKSGGGPMATIRGLPLRIHKLLFGLYTYRTFDELFRKNLYKIKVLKEDLSVRSGYGYAFAFDVANVDIAAVRAEFRKFDRQLGRFSDTVRRSGSALLVANIPERFTISTDRRDNFRHYPLAKIRLRPAQWMQDAARRHKFEYADLSAGLVDARTEMLASQRPYDPLYIANDLNHLNPLGHDIVSRQLAARLTPIIAERATPRQLQRRRGLSSLGLRVE
jgi:hypothetical protein